IPSSAGVAPGRRPRAVGTLEGRSDGAVGSVGGVASVCVVITVPLLGPAGTSRLAVAGDGECPAPYAGANRIRCTGLRPFRALSAFSALPGGHVELSHTAGDCPHGSDPGPAHR